MNKLVDKLSSIPGKAARKLKGTDAAESEEAAPRPASLQRVLLVEDDPVLALALEDALLRGGAGEVQICSTMKAAVDALEKGAGPTAVILDVHLGDRDDGWAIAELIGLLGTKLPRIVFSTGTPQDIPEDIAGMGPVFEKPYDADQLVTVLIGESSIGLFARLRDAL